MILFFDTETTGKYEFSKPPEFEGQPNLVQLACMGVHETSGNVMAQVNFIVQPSGFAIPDESAKIHGIWQETAERYGVPAKTVLSAFNQLCLQSKYLVAHNIAFDEAVMLTALHRIGAPHRMAKLKRICTMKAAAPVLKLPKAFKGKKGDEYKWPTLTETHEHFFKKDFDGAHNAMNDVIAMALCFRELRSIGAITLD